MTTAQGQVFDIGYQRYDGPREGRPRARMAIYKDAVRTSLGIGRGGRAKILPWAFIGALVMIGLVLALVAGTVNRVAPGFDEELNLPSHSDLYGFASIILFVFAAVVGPELLCPDRRNGVINLYLVRPVTGSDYLGARWLGFLTVMTVVTWLPQIVLLAGLALGDPEPAEYLADNWLDVPRFLLSGFVLAAYTSTLALAVASFTTRRSYASAFLVGLFVISAPFTLGLAESLSGTAAQWLSMFNLSNIPVHVNDIIFNDSSEVTVGTPARDLPEYILILWCVLWTVGPGIVLWLRYRRLSP